MNTRKWQNLLAEQAKLGKVLFTLTELANAAGVPGRIVNVEMTRLVKYGVTMRYAKGLYGLAGTVVMPDQLIPSMDPHAYITGAYALMKHGVVTQALTVITCFTTRRHYRREIQTPVGRIEFVCVKPPIYRREVRTIAGPELALCDFVYITLRRGMDPVGLLTFRRLQHLRQSLLARTVKRYPVTVRQCISTLVPG
jgi:hypothetical protein